MNDIVFNGYRLRTRLGRGFDAQLTRISLAEGRYSIWDETLSPLSYFHPHFGIPCETAAQNLNNTRSLNISAHGIFRNERQLVLYDASIGERTGIRTDRAFFRHLSSLYNCMPNEGYSLLIQYSAPWMVTAKAELGESEVRGSRANPRILEYFKASRFWGTDDSGGANAWCASFVSWIMKQHGYTPPSNAFRAKAWKDFGRVIEQPIYGAIGIKSRSGGGHVAFVIGESEDGTHLYMLGGNQSDEVNITRYPRNVWTTFVVPEDYDSSNDSLPIYAGDSVSVGSEA